MVNNKYILYNCNNPYNMVNTFMVSGQKKSLCSCRPMMSQMGLMGDKSGDAAGHGGTYRARRQLTVARAS